MKRVIVSATIYIKKYCLCRTITQFFVTFHVLGQLQQPINKCSVINKFEVLIYYSQVTLTKDNLFGETLNQQHPGPNLMIGRPYLIFKL